MSPQIRVQCEAFREGLSDVINIEWLRMFNSNELQVLISGAPVPIDIDDLRRFTVYSGAGTDVNISRVSPGQRSYYGSVALYLYTCVSGGYTDDHPVIVAFWQVINDFTEQQRRQLLKFVTSCSRPPLLGFTVSAVDCRSHNTTGSKQTTF